MALQSEKTYSALLEYALDAALLIRPDGAILYANPAACSLFGYTLDEFRTLGQTAVMDPSDPRFTEAMKERHQAGRFSGVLRMMRKDRSAIEAELSSAILTNDSGEQFISNFVRDITERNSAEEKNRQQAKKMATLLETGKILTSTLDLDVVLQNITESAANILKLETAAIYLFENDKLYLGATTPPLPKDFPDSYRHAALIDHPHIQKVLETGQPVLVPDTETEKLTPAERGICEVRGLRSILYIPLTSKNQTIGVLIPAFTKKPGVFTENDVEICCTLSHQAALAIINAQLHRNVLQYARELESRIAERKQAEEALKESREQFSTVVEKSPISMALVNMKGDIEYINLKAIETFGYLPQDIPNMDSWWMRAYPDKTYRDQVMTQWMELVNEALLNKHEIEKREYHVTCMDGAVKIVLIYGVWIGDKVLAVFDDITELKLAEKALRSSEYRFRTIIEQAPTGIQVVDMETRKVVYANPAICKVLGYTEQEFRSFPVTELVVDDAPLKPVEEFDQHIRSEMQISERTFRRKDGSLVRMSIHSVPMEISGRPCLVGFLSDISEKHLLEQERLKTQKLEAVGTLAGGIAHDFNNLLQGIFGYISLAKLAKDNRDKSLEALEQAEQALHMTVRLTNQLLTFSKGGKPIKKTLVLHPIIDIAAKFALSGSRTNFRLKADDGLWKVDVDEGQIGQVIQNIVLNADQAMPDPGTIQIAAKNVRLPGPNYPQTLTHGKYVEITITDTGLGIQDKYLRRIFDPYFTTKEKGSGLGLATSYSIIKNHNGEIDVRSELGKGATFLIYLPATIAVKHEEPTKLAALTPGKKGRVLVMDDESFILNIAGELIKTLGHEVAFATNGTEALEKYHEAKRSGQPFDIAILDLTIRGGMGGVETVKRLLEADPQVKAVVSSGYSDDAAIANYQEQGFKAVLKKPYSVDKLQDVLDSLMNT